MADDGLEETDPPVPRQDRPVAGGTMTPIDTILDDWINGGHLTLVDQHHKGTP